MGEIRIQCHHCSQELSLPASVAGKRAKCPQCDAIFNIEPSSITAPSVEPNPYNAPALDESTSGSSGFNTGVAGTKSPYDDSNPPPLGLMTIPLYISAVIYLLIGLGVIVLGAFVGLGDGQGEQSVAFVALCIMIFGALLSFCLAGFIIFFTGKLRQRKKWAWITAIAFGALYTPSAFIFMGVPILIGALKPEVQAWFNSD